MSSYLDHETAKRPYPVDYKLCIICQESTQNKRLIKNPNISSIEKLVDACNVRESHRDGTVRELKNIISSLPKDDIAGLVYHKECYTSLTNKKTIEQIVRRSESVNKSNCLTPKPGRLKNEGEGEENVTPTSACTRRKSEVQYLKDKCIICQEDKGEKLHKVEFTSTGQHMLEVSKGLTDKAFFMRLNTIPNASDAFANDTIYHLKCWVTAKRKAKPDMRDSVQDITNFHHVACDIELISYTKFMLDQGNILDMNTLHGIYRNSLVQTGMNENDLLLNYKPYIKQLVSENIQSAEFVKAPRCNMPERIIHRKTNEEVVDTTMKENTFEELQEVYKVATMIRNELLSIKEWHFQGSFDDFTLPNHLSLLIKWILIGSEKVLASEKRRESVNRDISTICQIIQKATKSKRQVGYEPKNNDKGFSQAKETPFSVGVGLKLYQETRSKKLVDMFANLHLSIPYHKVMEIKQTLVEDVKKKTREKGGIYVPSALSPNKPLFFAIDNIDLTIDTPDGKDQLHGTTQVVFQEKDEQFEQAELPIERSYKLSIDKKPLYDVSQCREPQQSNEVYQTFEGLTDIQQTDTFKKWDYSWALARVFDKERKIPTWAALNSLCTEPNHMSNYCSTPIIPGSPTDWSNLYTSLKLVQGINVSQSSNHKTIVSLDLQLYSKCVKLQSRDDIKHQFVFRLGELHILFAMLKVIGKNINQSGLDEALIEAEVYGPNTLEQIKGGKHYKRSFNAFLTIYLALFELYVDEAFSEKVISRVSAKEAISKQSDNGVWSLTNLVADLQECGIFTDLKEFDSQLRGQPKVYRNFMDLVDIMLLFIRASRQGLWELHLASLDMFVKYFFAYDQQNYARLSPVYLSEMFVLKEKDPATWKFLKDGNFCVNKSSTSFCALGTDHALEQENKKLKVLGGISGIANKTAMMDSYFIAAPISNKVCESFSTMFLPTEKSKQQHHQLTESANLTSYKNANKLLNVFEHHEVDFANTPDVFNILTNKVLDAGKASMFLDHSAIGKEMYDEFKKERLRGEVSIWEPLKKKKLPTFAATNETFKTKLHNKIVEIKEEKKLLSKFVIASRKREDIDLPAYLGKYEFSVVPRSMFRQDGGLLLGSDKSSVMHMIENMVPAGEDVNSTTTRRVMIFDGMAVVNRLKKTPEIENCKDLASLFTKIVNKEAKDHDEVRMIFDRYQENSIKDQTRNKRTQGMNVRYKITDEMKIQGLSIKKLLSHVKTKHDLTKFLGDHLANDLNKIGKRYAIVYHNQCITNIPRFEDNLLQHNHEEADTLLILHAIDVGQNDPFQELTILSPDTDVFLLLIYYHSSLCNHTIFKTGRGRDVREINITEAYEAIGPNVASAILGFHSFTGCDFTAKFNGKSKKSCWNAFLNSTLETKRVFAELTNPNAEIEEVAQGLESFVLDLYCKKRPSNVNDLARLRWYMFSKYQHESTNLPPTSAALKMKILRSHLVAKIWSQSHLSQMYVSDPTKHGWERLEDGNLKATTTSLPPAPKAVIEMSLCRCKKLCDSKRCICVRSGLVCTEMCFCENCKNQNDESHDESDSDDDDEDSDNENQEYDSDESSDDD